MNKDNDEYNFYMVCIDEASEFIFLYLLKSERDTPETIWKV